MVLAAGAGCVSSVYFQGRECPVVVLPDRALCLPTISHLLILYVNPPPPPLSLSLSCQSHVRNASPAHTPLRKL